jgi:abhydrolase domain-containing protein 6
MSQNHTRSHSVDRIRSKLFDGYISGDLNGEPVIFFHGWAGSKDIWLGFLKSRPTDYTHISLDLPGTGTTPGLDQYCPQKLAEWLQEVVDHLGIKRFHLVGHSMGGNIAAWCSHHLGDRVISLTLVSPALAGNTIRSAAPYFSRFGKINMELTCFGAELIALLDVFHPHHHDQSKWRAWIRRYRYVRRDNSSDGLLTQLRFLIDSPFDLRLLNSNLPVLIIHGTSDATIPVDRSRELAVLRLKNTRLLIYRASMHCPMDEDQNRLSADLMSFVRAASAGGSNVV